MTAKTLPPIHAFRAGRHTAMSGAVIEFSAQDLAASAAAYDPKVYPAPIVVGHPAIDAPAYGWVASLQSEGEDLYVHPDQVEAQFADLVSEGRYKRVSMSWFPPAHPRNPVPGVYYPKHLGFLGAAAPAVAGLKPVELSADDEGCVTVEFGELDGWMLRNIFRRFREWLIESAGMETADRIIPDYSIESIELPDAPQAMPAYSEPTQGESMTPEEKARLDALEAENARLKAEADVAAAKTAEFADREAALAAREAEARAGEVAEFADGLVKAGRVLPRDRDGLVAYLSGADAIEFAESDATVQKPAADWLRGFLSALPVQVDFAERGAPEGDGAAGGAASFAAPDGYAVDPGAMDLHRRAVAYQTAHAGTDYLAAVKAVSRT
jgi:hypothetical protein